MTRLDGVIIAAACKGILWIVSISILFHSKLRERERNRKQTDLVSCCMLEVAEAVEDKLKQPIKLLIVYLLLTTTTLYR